MHVGKVGSGRNLQYNDSSISNLLADSVLTNVNMLDALVVDRVASQIDCTFYCLHKSGRFQFRSQVQAAVVS